MIFHVFIQRFCEIEYSGYDEEIDNSKEQEEKRGTTITTWKGKFRYGEPVAFDMCYNCTSNCQIPVIGAGAKLVLCFSTFIGPTYVREYTHEITVASTLKKRYDEYMIFMEGQMSSEEEEERTRKRRRTTNK